MFGGRGVLKPAIVKDVQLGFGLPPAGSLLKEYVPTKKEVYVVGRAPLHVDLTLHNYTVTRCSRKRARQLRNSAAGQIAI